MEINYNQWQESMITKIEERIAGFPDQKKAFINGDLLKKIIGLVPSKTKSETDLQEQLRIDDNLYTSKSFSSSNTWNGSD